jgi:hypothetical protein
VQLEVEPAKGGDKEVLEADVVLVSAGGQPVALYLHPIMMVCTTPVAASLVALVGAACSVATGTHSSSHAAECGTMATEWWVR